MPKSLKNYLTTTASSALPATSEADFGAMVEDVQFNSGASAGETNFLSFSGKRGVYALGRGKEPVDPEQIYLMEPQSMVEGYVCWKGGRPIGRHEWSLYAPAETKVAANDLDDHGPYRDGEGWKDMLGFGAIALSSMQDQLKFTNNSASGVNSIKDLFNESRKRFLAGEPYIPAIYFDMEEFTAHDQTNWKPMFPVEAWLTRAGVTAYMADAIDVDALLAGTEKPARAKKGKAKKAPARKGKK